jgi:hypothetical protein
MSSVSFRRVFEDENFLVLEDTGPWNLHLTMTNGAVLVAESVGPELGNRRLFYFDSHGDLDEMLIHNGAFVGFAHDEATEKDLLDKMGRAAEDAAIDDLFDRSDWPPRGEDDEGSQRPDIEDDRV